MQISSRLQLRFRLIGLTITDLDIRDDILDDAKEWLHFPYDRLCRIAVVGSCSTIVCECGGWQLYECRSYDFNRCDDDTGIEGDQTR